MENLMSYFSVVEKSIGSWANCSTDRMQPTGHQLEILVVNLGIYKVL